MSKVLGKDLTGYQYANGVHWFWGTQEIAVIDNVTSDIEWYVPLYKLPAAVITEIRELKPKVSGKWLIETKRIKISTTQEEIAIFINGKEVIRFGSEVKIGDDGEYHSIYSDEELGKLVYSLFWNKHDDICHYSDKAKDVFYPKWRFEEDQ